LEGFWPKDSCPRCPPTDATENQPESSDGINQEIDISSLAQKAITGVSALLRKGVWSSLGALEQALLAIAQDPSAASGENFHTAMQAPPCQPKMPDNWVWWPRGEFLRYSSTAGCNDQDAMVSWLISQRALACAGNHIRDVFNTTRPRDWPARPSLSFTLKTPNRDRSLDPKETESWFEYIERVVSDRPGSAWTSADDARGRYLAMLDRQYAFLKANDFFGYPTAIKRGQGYSP
jgi:hypothetical protein